MCTRISLEAASSSARRAISRGIDRGLVDRTLAHHFVRHQLVLAVQEEDAELFARLVLHLPSDIFQQGRPGGDHFAFANLLQACAALQFGHGFQIGGNGFADALHLDEIGSRGGPRDSSLPRRSSRCPCQ